MDLQLNFFDNLSGDVVTNIGRCITGELGEPDFPRLSGLWKTPFPPKRVFSSGLSNLPKILCKSNLVREH